MKHFAATLFIIFICNTIIFGQQQNPLFLHWKKITTPNFEIVFPENIIETGMKVANMMEFYYSPLSQTLTASPKKLSVFLYNQSTISNGYFSLAPRYSAWYTTPSQNANFQGSTEWLRLLGIHEYRHVVQHENRNKKLVRFFDVLFGDYGHSISSYTYPSWFSEGDAVLTETLFTQSGRGRQPAFGQQIRTLLINDVVYNYDIANHRSYKNYYPNHYELGYFLATYGRRTYDADFWNKVIERYSRFSILPYSFSRSIKKIGNETIDEFYENAMNEVGLIFKNQIVNYEFTETQIINDSTSKHSFTNYNTPQFYCDGSIIALKNGLDFPTTLTKIEIDGSEKKVMQLNATDISINGKFMCWAEYTNDIRWGERSYSDIYLLDCETKKISRVSKQEKYFSPSPSKDGEQLVAVQYNEMLQCNLVTINTSTGEILNKYQIGTNDFLRTPTWSSNGKKIVFTNSNESGLALSTINLETGSVTQLLPYSNEVITQPIFYNNYVIYSSSYSGIDNIYAIDTETLERFQIINSKYGAKNPAVSEDGLRLVFEEYSIEGNNIAQISLEPQKWIPINNVPVLQADYFAPLQEQEEIRNDIQTQNIQDINYPISKYRQFKNLINIHSWAIIPSNTEISAMLFSVNKLNTMQLNLGGAYNLNEQTVNSYFSAAYAGFPVIFHAGANTQLRSIAMANTIEAKNMEWTEKYLNFGVELPLNLSHRVWNTTLNISSFLNFNSIENQENIELNNKINTSVSTIRFSNSITSSYRSIHPKWKQTLDIKYGFVTNSEKSNYSYSIVSQLYFPSLVKHHSLNFELAAEKQNNDEYYFQSSVLFPRGYDFELHKEYYKISTNYTLPIAYPDWRIKPILFVKRIRGNFFYDYAYGKTDNFTKTYNSFGAEIIFDVHIFRIEIPISSGLRVSYLPDENTKVYNFILFATGLQ